MEVGRSPATNGLYNGMEINEYNTDGVLSYNSPSMVDSSDFYYNTWVYIPTQSLSNGQQSVEIIRSLFAMTLTYSLTSNTSSVLSCRTTSNQSTTYLASKNYSWNDRPIKYDSWHNVCVTGSVGVGVNVYVDGILETSSIMPYPLDGSNTSYPLDIGRLADYTMYVGAFNMSSTNSLDAQEVSEFIGDDGQGNPAAITFNGLSETQKLSIELSSSLLGDVPYSGQELKDFASNTSYTDNSSNGLVFNSPSPLYTITTSEVPPSIFNVNSANLNGVDQYLNVTKSTELGNLNGSQTWSIRCKFDDVDSKDIIYIMTLNADTPSFRSSRLFINNFIGDGAFEFAIYPTIGVTGGSISLNLTEEPQADVWYHILVGVNLDTDEAYMFVNGTKYTATYTPNTVDSGSSAYDMMIGNDRTPPIYSLDGTTGVTRVWNRALSDAEALEDYNGDAELYDCYELLSSGLKSGLIFDSDLATFGDHMNPLEVNAGNSTIANIGSTPFTGTGLQVECTS